MPRATIPTILPRMSPDPRLEAVLARLCERLGGRIWKTQAVKLPYLVDLVAAHALGRKITETRHEAWDMGVVATSAWSLVKHEKGGEHFSVEATEREDACQLVLRRAPEIELDDSELEIIDFVAAEYGRIPLDRLMTLTKAINPGIKNWGPPSDQIVETEEAYRLLPQWLGEDEADAQIARDRFRAIDADPRRLMRGAEAEEFLEALVN